MPPSTTGAPKAAKKLAGKKKASWRKAIDITDITTGLDEVRAEERQVGCVLSRAQARALDEGLRRLTLFLSALQLVDCGADE